LLNVSTARPHRHVPDSTLSGTSARYWESWEPPPACSFCPRMIVPTSGYTPRDSGSGIGASSDPRAAADGSRNARQLRHCNARGERHYQERAHSSIRFAGARTDIAFFTPARRNTRAQQRKVATNARSAVSGAWWPAAKADRQRRTRIAYTVPSGSADPPAARSGCSR
jgi:hypothetical protein